MRHLPPVFTSCWHEACNPIHRTDIFFTVISPHRWHPGGGRRAFTLVEMVTIIAIIVILLVAGVSLVGDTGHQARRAGADLLTGMIEQARTTAITSRSHVVLAVAEPGDLPTGDNRCRLGIFKVPNWPETTGGAPPGEISAVLMSRWRILENGVVLIGGNVGDGGSTSLPNPLDGPELSLRFGPAGKERTIRVHAIAFNPRGGLHFPTGSHPIAVRIAEGAYRNGVASPNRRGDSQTISENRLKIGRVIARPYRIDG